MSRQPASSLFLFLSSPGDVTPERIGVREEVEEFSAGRHKNGYRTIEVVAWDTPAHGTALEATLTPQEAINRGMRMPSECDIVLVILWSRMGTPLPPEITKEDGTRYDSGTEWEYLDAVREHGRRSDSRPRVYVFRRQDPPIFSGDDPDMASRMEQWNKVRAFFSRFQNEDGSLKGSYYTFRDVNELRTQVRRILSEIVTGLESLPTMVRVADGDIASVRKSGPRSRPARNLPILNFWSVSVGKRGFCVPVHSGLFFLSTGVNVLLHSVRDHEPLARYSMPKFWKHALTQGWNGNLVVSDWDGGIFTFPGSPNARSQGGLVQPRADGVPVHRMAVDESSGTLFAAGWDGVVRGWDSSGCPLFRVAIARPGSFIRQVTAMRDGGCAVLVGESEIVLLEHNGDVRRRYEVPPDVTQFTAMNRSFVMQSGNRTLVRLEIETGRRESVRFHNSITAVGARTDDDSDWLIVAQDNGVLDWLPVDSLAVDAAQQIRSNLIVREIRTVFDSDRPAALTAIGLTDDGRVILVNNHELTECALPEDVRHDHLMLCDEGRLSCLVGQAGVTVLRTPSFASSGTRIVLVNPEGSLVQHQFGRLTLRLRNVGRHSLTRVDVDLVAGGTISSARVIEMPTSPVAPGDEFLLVFSVCPSAIGDIAATLKISIADEFGPTQETQQIPVLIHSRRDG